MRTEIIRRTVNKVLQNKGYSKVDKQDYPDHISINNKLFLFCLFGFFPLFVCFKRIPVCHRICHGALQKPGGASPDLMLVINIIRKKPMPAVCYS